MRLAAAVLPIALAFSVPACATDGEEPHQLLPIASEPNFHLYVSNQSFDLDLVDIQVYVDGDLAVAGDFPVGSQHSWFEFPLQLGPGEHAIRSATEAGDSERVDTVDIADQPRFGVVSFWFYDESSTEPTGPELSFNLFDDPPGFD